MTQAVMIIWPPESKSIPQGLLVPWAKTSNTCRVGWYGQIAAFKGVRSASNDPGLPTREWVKTPWQP